MGLVENHPHSWPKPLRPLEHREFRLLWTGTLISNAGSWMQRVATGWLVYTLTGSAAWLGVDAFAAGIPIVLLLPLGGVLADRVDRRALLIVANVVSATLALVLAGFWWGGLLQVWHIIGVSFLSGVVGAAMIPASQSMLPAVAGEDHLPVAVALNSIQYNVARAMGPALGGLALLWDGPGWCFVLNAASFLVLTAVLLALRNIPTRVKSTQPFVRSIGEGIRFLRGRADLRLTLVMVGLLALSSAPVVSMLPALAKGVLHQNASAYSALLTSFGIGAAVIGIVLTFWPAAEHTRKLVFVMIMVVGLCHVGLTWAYSIPVAAVLVGLSGACFVGAMIEMGTALLKDSPDEFRGRVSSVQQMIFRSVQPLGGLAAGLLAGHTGVAVAFLLFGTALTVLALGVGIGHFLRPPTIQKASP